MDRIIQRRLLFALILLEVGLVSICLLILYWDLIGAIEQDMFRIHDADASDSTQIFVQTITRVLSGFMAVNLVALALGEWIWGRYVDSVLNDFAALVARTAELDFTADPENSNRHEILDLAMIWRTHERNRFVRLKTIVERLNPDMDLADREERAALRLALARFGIALGSKLETDGTMQAPAIQQTGP